MSPPPGLLDPAAAASEDVAAGLAGDGAFGRSAVCEPADTRDASDEAAGIPLEPRREGVGERSESLDWARVFWVGGVHLAALAAPFFVSWSGLALCRTLSGFTGSLGVCLGYHRLLTHGSLVTFAPARFVFALIGGLSGEGSALIWVANHRKHHAFSDQEGDPHSPRDGGLWAHMLWMFPGHTREEMDAHTRRWAPDLARDGSIQFLHRTFLLWHVLVGAALLAGGWWVGGPRLAASWLLWGFAVRMVIVFHVTWLVNSATHMWGDRNYETTDDSTNLWWVGLLAFGEGWHNNHHAFQRMARHGHRWWEVDTTYWFILLLERLGLAWDVVHTPHGVGRGRTPRRR
ncbi:MAG: acyl-CoA desaturase [Planctomycetaceae bacterium]